MNDDLREMTRRGLLTTGAGGAIAGALVAAEGERNVNHNVYEQLGIKPIINAAGTITALGGSLMPPEVVAAWNAAAQGFVRLSDLQDRVGERIAARLGVDAALVTTGAAGGIVLGTAAAITYRHPELIAKLPLPASRASRGYSPADASILL